MKDQNKCDKRLLKMDIERLLIAQWIQEKAENTSRDC